LYLYVLLPVKAILQPYFICQPPGDNNKVGEAMHMPDSVMNILSTKQHFYQYIRSNCADVEN